MNPSTSSAPPAEPARASGADLTLDELLHSVAYTRLPSQFYLTLQLAVPAAAELWSLGWLRSAGWMLVVSLYGIWALCAKRLDEAEYEERPSSWAIIGRSLSKGAGIILAGALGIEGLVRILRLVFPNPGGAG